MASNKESGTSVESSDDESGSNKAVWLNVILIILIVLIVILLIILILVCVGVFGFAGKDMEEMEWSRNLSESRKGDHGMEGRMLLVKEPSKTPNGTRIKFRFYAPGDMTKLEVQSLEENKNYCNEFKRKLPMPKSEFDELEMIEDIKILHETANCNTYSIGYKTDVNMRYMSLNEKKIWPSLRKDRLAGTDVKNRDCIQIKTYPSGRMDIIDSKPCSDLNNITDLTGFQRTSDICVTDIWGTGCLHYVTNGTGTVDEIIQSQENNRDVNFIGVMLLDREMIPLRLLARRREASSWMFEVKYVMNYLDVYDSNLAPYKINITVFQDPEQECVAVNSKRLFQLETVLCNHAGCPACEEEKPVKWI